ncbi:MAG: hypothetical protein C5B52_00255 [Bacteroidetes bacterium]|nr:MAG: hypothetical protein C5B52_00255 [Bacteroidota bacterium]
MKKAFFTMALMYGLCAIAFAQNQVAFKINAGISSAMVKSDVDGEKENTKCRIGFTAGVATNIPLGQHLSFEPGLNYLQKGGKQNVDQAKYEVVLNYIEMPLNLLYKTSSKSNSGNFFVGAGPSLAYGVSGKIKLEEAGNSESVKIKFGNGDDDDLKALDIGANLIAGYQFKSGFSLCANYNLGLSNSFHNGDGTWKNNYFGIRMGYAFPSRR